MTGFLESLATGIRQADAGEFWFWTCALGVASLLLLGLAFRQLRQSRLIQDTPVSRIRSAAQGYVHLQGHACLLPGPEILSPLSRERCCWWWYRVERLETTYRNGKRSTEWVTVEADTSGELFQLSDETGDCIVDPAGATVYPSIERRWRGHTQRPGSGPGKRSWFGGGDYRYSEKLVRTGDYLFALGQFRSQGSEQQFDESNEVRELLAEWKADRVALLGRFDADRNGEIDQHEWEAVRRAAIDAVRSRQLQHSLDPDIHVLDRSRDGRPFLLSTLSVAQLVKRQRITVFFSLLGFLALGCAAIFALQARGLAGN
ncbi:hypothetical protein D0B54_17580 [Solimonas sp. K1W22B-7]|uniref:GIDE domain-containing protein n=1 Tax=Solimonas sp. K1W22B-7 TaxID=2303331 RepID=UPI000E335E95|nr:GIDE domain-containing protein [Solimonas sp. K1W22B-7]AXQ30372.1 hypothetical protein D0B54_17580 [Solimonas sp. K1W22B-7]